jgi:hypothetical protein
MKIKLLLVVNCWLFGFGLKAQNMSSDSLGTSVNKDAIYERPFIQVGKAATALGGYLEGNTNYFVTDGATEGFSMELRRFNIFLYSTIGKRIKFLSELEFEHGTEEINLETALIDFELNPAFNFRAGIILAPIGAFNQNHDSPKWEFIERPLVSTKIIPSTLSETGFGFHGKLFTGDFVFSYETYVVNGLRDGVILNSEGRTFLPAGKSPEMVGEDNNGTPMFTGRVAVKHRKIAEIGLSYYGGTYNTFKLEGIKVDEKRNLSIYAIDFNSKIMKLKINGEFVLANIDVPASAGNFNGNKQWGGYIEGVYPILKRSIFKYKSSVINLNLRLEAVDFNVGKFAETRADMGDEIKAIVPGISFRPSANTVIRANYRYHWETDFFGNPPVRTAGFQVGFASYF